MSDGPLIPVTKQEIWSICRHRFRDEHDGRMKCSRKRVGGWTRAANACICEGLSDECPVIEEFTTPRTQQCPNCGEWLPDHDGFGVLRHEECGYCKHPTWDGQENGTMKCSLCGKVENDEKPD